jgi:hypothetical protein
MKVIRYTIFDSLPDGNGADKRTAQVTEILNEAGIESTFIKKDGTMKIPLSTVLIRCIPILTSFIPVIPISYFKNIRLVFRAVKDYIRTEKTLNEALQSDTKTFLWECTRCNNFFVPILAKKYNKQVIAIPHNLESLVPLQESTISLRSSPHWFNEEIRYLSACHKVFCISREETLFLKLFGLDAYYLPYFPTREIEAYFINIKDKRKARHDYNKKVEKILMVGSANNQPTRLGMIDRIKFFAARSSNHYKISIAGFYTQTLAEDTTIPQNIDIKGTLNAEELEKELIDTDAVLIHQAASTGALTRISELLLSGIPIFLNLPSARNYYDLPGLYVYEDDDQLIELLQSQKVAEIHTPLKPVKEEQTFIRNII